MPSLKLFLETESLHRQETGHSCSTCSPLLHYEDTGSDCVECSEKFWKLLKSVWENIVALCFLCCASSVETLLLCRTEPKLRLIFKKTPKSRNGFGTFDLNGEAKRKVTQSEVSEYTAVVEVSCCLTAALSKKSLVLEAGSGFSAALGGVCSIKNSSGSELGFSHASCS